MRIVRYVLSWILCVAALGGSAAFAGDNSGVVVIQNIPVGGYHITEPGTYVFDHDLTWTPTADSSAILIEANDVVLDMQGYTLLSTPTQFKTIGILAEGCVMLRIYNGTVKNMGLSGVKCEQSLDIMIRDVVVDGLNADDIINYTVPTGILATECINVIIDKCTVKNINVQTGSSAGIQLTATLSSRVSNCVVENMFNKDGACTGIGHLACDNAIVTGCTVNNLQSTFINNLNTEGHTTIGLVPVLSTNLKIEKCTISNIIGCCDDAHGVSIFLCAGAIVRKCKVDTVVDGVGPAQRGAKATGIEVYADFVKVSDCHVKNITAINPEDKQATGFSCAFCLAVEFLKCKAENVSVIDENGQQDAALGYGTGFGWAPDPRPEFISPSVAVLYKQCTAECCQVGFDSWYHINSLWDHVVSKYNDIPVLVQPFAQRTISCDPCSECGCLQVGCYPTPHSVTLTNVAENNEFLYVKIKD